MHIDPRRDPKKEVLQDRNDGVSIVSLKEFPAPGLTNQNKHESAAARYSYKTHTHCLWSESSFALLGFWERKRDGQRLNNLHSRITSLPDISISDLRRTKSLLGYTSSGGVWRSGG